MYSLPVSRSSQAAIASMLALALLSGCMTTSHKSAPTTSPVQGNNTGGGAVGQAPIYACTYTPQTKGGFYKEDGPLDLPANIDQILEPIPRAEPLNRWANNPYTVLGQNFVPRKTIGDYSNRGIASWYGRKFHGQKTSSGEVYDMFQMTAAHPTLPIPSYARVTNLKNNRSVIVRINDRGPFLRGREIDLSFLAACRLGYATNGSTEVEVVSLIPGESLPTTFTSTQPVNEAPVVQAIPLPAIQKTETAPAPSTGKEVYLQLGAFGSRSNAETFQAQLIRELEDLPQPSQLTIQQSGNLFRVRLGPFMDRNAALAEAEKLTGKRNLSAIVVR